MLDSLGPNDILLADRAYDANKLRAAISEKGAWANIPPMPQRKEKPAFCKFLYRYRNHVERFFSKIKHYRAIATRFEKKDINYLAAIQLVSVRLWLQFNESVT